MAFVATCYLILSVQNAFKELGYWVPEKDIQLMMQKADFDGFIRYTSKADGKNWDIILTDVNDGFLVSIRRLR